METMSTKVGMAAAASLLVLGPAAPAAAITPEEQFVNDIKRSNSVATTVPGTPERWIAAGWASCNRISSAVAQGARLQQAINNEVIAARTFNVISQQDATAVVTYAVLDLCPNLIPNKGDAGPGG